MEKPIGFIGYRLNLLNELKTMGNSGTEKEIEENISNSKRCLSDKVLEYLYIKTNNQVEIQNIKNCIKWCKKRLTYLNSIEESRYLNKEEYKKKKERREQNSPTN